jgi:hypothetical protein
MEGMSNSGEFNGYRGSTLQLFNDVCSTLYRFITFPNNFLKISLVRPIHFWCSRTPDGVRCAHFSSDITTVIDYNYS